MARPRRLTDQCFIVAAEATGDHIGPDLRAKGMLFPGQANILETEVTTATRVAVFMFDAWRRSSARVMSGAGSKDSSTRRTTVPSGAGGRGRPPGFYGAQTAVCHTQGAAPTS